MVQSTTPISGIPAIPEVTSDDAEMNLLLSALKESIEVLTGTRGNPNSRALTFGEATQDGATGLFATNQIVQLAQSSQDSVRLTGDVVGTGLFDSGGAVVVPALLQLPNIIRIDGGASDTVYASQIAGPYGIEGTPAGGTTGQVFGKLSDTDYDYGWITQVGFGAGGGTSIVQIDEGLNRSEFGTAGTAIPFDNTTPQITEGDQIMSNTVVPVAGGHVFTIEVSAFITCTTLSDWVTVALFKNSEPDAIASTAVFIDTALGGQTVEFTHYENTVDTTPIQYTVRVGQEAGTAIGFNAVISGGTQPRLNNNFASRLTVTETDLSPSTGLGTDTAVQANGLTLTAAATLLNFVDFTVVETLPDQITISGAGIVTQSLFCPDYTFVFVDATTWRIENLDVTNLFRPGRRLQFSAGGDLKYGTIFSRVFSGGHTDITMIMEGGDVLTASATEVCFTIAATAWSPISDDPFSGTAIRDIATGVISSVQYWVIVGDGGKLAYSTNGGVDWTTVATGTSEDLVSVAYASDTEGFLAGGGAGVLLDSSDGTTWNLDTTSLPALATTGTADVQTVNRSAFEGEWYIVYDGILANWQTVRDQGTLTWVLPPFQIGQAVEALKVFNDGSSATLYLLNGTDDTAFLSNTIDISVSPLIANMFGSLVPATANFYDEQASADRHTYGSSDGQVRLYNGNTLVSQDSLSFTDAHRCFTYSATFDRWICVGDNAQIGYLDGQSGSVSSLEDDAWVSITSGLAPAANFTAVDWNDTDLVFIAVGDNGQILRSTNGLGDAAIKPVYTGFGLISQDPFSGGVINRIMTGEIAGVQWWVAIGTAGQIYTSNDKGLTWTARTSGTTENLLCISYDSNNEAFAIGTTSGELLHTTDGITWARNTTAVPGFDVAGGSNNVYQITFDPASDAWHIIIQNAAGAYTGSFNAAFTVFVRRDSSEPTGGFDIITSYSNFNVPRIIYGDIEDTRQVAAATVTSGSIHLSRSIANGVVTAAFVKGPIAGNVENCCAGIGDGTIEQFDDTTLQSRSVGALGAQVNMFAYSNTSDRWVAVGNNGKIATMVDADFNGPASKIWVPVNNSFTGNIADVVYNSADDVFVAVSNQGEIGRSTNGNDDAAPSTNWTQVTSPFAPINAIETGIIDGTNYWVAVGNSGQISTSDDEGATWVAQTSGSATNLVSVAYNSDDEQFAIGGVGEVLWNTLADITTWNIATSAGLVANVGQIEWFASSSVWQLFENNFSDAMWTMSIAGALAEVDASNALGQFIEYNVHGAQTGMYGVDGTVSIERYITATSSSPTSTFNHGNAIAGMAFIERPGGLTSYVAAYSGSDTVITANAGVVQATHNNFSGGLGIAVEYSSSNDNFCIVTSFGEIGIINQTDWIVNNSIIVVGHSFDRSAFTDVKWDPVASKYIAVNASGEVGYSANGST